jgi:hypothetical protein
MATKEQAHTAIMLATKHVANEALLASSAAYALSDAIHNFEHDRFDSAVMWARTSMAYSVGVLHPDYKAAA